MRQRPPSSVVFSESMRIHNQPKLSVVGVKVGFEITEVAVKHHKITGSVTNRSVQQECKKSIAR